MRGINSNSIDLIATDPPFNSKRIYNALEHSKASDQKFDDRWKWDDVTDEWQDLIAVKHPAIKELIEAAVVIEGGTVAEKTGKINTGIENSIAAFLVWMAPRLIEMQRILKPTGSIYLHCDSSANSYLRLLMDAIFGRRNFRNDIVWCYKENDTATKHFPRKHDTLLFYSKSDKYVFHVQRGEITEAQKKRYNHIIDGERYANMKGKMRKLKGGAKIRDWWDMPIAQSSERTGWKTQKPLALYERIIKASSNEGDLVLDPFCGCATTCVAAERLKRHWVGIDIDPIAETITQDRLWNAAGLEQHIDYSYVTAKKHPPKRTDIESISAKEMKLRLWNKQGRLCGNPYCTLRHVARHVDLDLDHVIPKSRGGSDDILNRIGLCGNCNGRKGRKAWGSFLDDERAKQAHPKVGQ